MNRTAIIFDGENDHEIGTEYFFQHPLIRDLNKEQVKELYISTATYENVLAIEYCDSPSHEKVKTGLAIMEQMVIDMWGNVKGNSIIQVTNKFIHEV